MRGARLGLLAATIACGALVAAPVGPAAAATARRASPAVVLINQPARSVCVGRKFTVGVWFQQISGGSRRYRVAVSGPRHRRFFYRAGQAPASHWRFWKVLAGRAGRYRTVYSSHRPGSAKWTTYVATTRAHRCS